MHKTSSLTSPRRVTAQIKRKFRFTEPEPFFRADLDWLFQNYQPQQIEAALKDYLATATRDSVDMPVRTFCRRAECFVILPRLYQTMYGERR